MKPKTEQNISLKPPGPAPEKPDQISFSRILEWSVLILGLVYLIYLLKILKKEKSTYLAFAKKQPFHRLILLIPSWWRKTEEKNFLGFVRNDTKLEWKTEFYWNENKEVKNSAELLEDFLNKENIELDEVEKYHSLNIEQNKEFFKDQSFKDQIQQVLRVESTGTQDSERIYLDVFIILFKDSDHYLLAKSISSILNGMIEGVYFEEVMKRLKLNQ